ncbi:hypothetical protein TIFTF001_004626 [Ficus carica]|uniref:Uncharacterized protein n=1 Tax=Ficus carica TaxID=3494 RepID=A0AA88CXJ0_FICCA|nr:hypothetical protein TIFTF001_004626 [Ficus carica]
MRRDFHEFDTRGLRRCSDLALARVDEAGNEEISKTHSSAVARSLDHIFLPSLLSLCSLSSIFQSLPPLSLSSSGSYRPWTRNLRGIVTCDVIWVMAIVISASRSLSRPVFLPRVVAPAPPHLSLSLFFLSVIMAPQWLAIGALPSVATGLVREGRKIRNSQAHPNEIVNQHNAIFENHRQYIGVSPR